MTRFDADELRAQSEDMFAVFGKGNMCAQMLRQAAEDAGRLEWVVANRGKYHVMGSDERGWAVMDTRNGLSIKTRGHKTMQDAIDAARKENT